MKCGKCGSDIPSESKFCPSCGQPLSGGRIEGKQPAELPKKNTKLWAAIAGLCLVAAVAIAMHYARGPKVTQANPVPGPTQAPVVNVPGRPGAIQPNVLNTDVKNHPITIPKTDKPAPPADVVAYLDHLSKVEKLRQDMTAKELDALVAMAPKLIAKAYPLDENFEEPKGPKELSSTAGQYSKEWQQIAQYFLSVPAPPACAALATKYYDSLREFVSFMIRFQDATNKSDLAGLQSMKRDQTSIDTKLNDADKELADVCTKNGIEKSFSIKSDTGQTPILGF